jgi:copper(I)-binding protein
MAVEGTWASAQGPRTALVYFGLSNNTDRDDVLLGASSDLAEHAVVRGRSARGAMKPVTSLAIPAGGHLDFEPGSYDVELVGVNEHLGSGSTVELELRFMQAGTVDVTAGVR